MDNLEHILKEQHKIEATQHNLKENSISYFTEILDSIPDNDGFEDEIKTIKRKCEDGSKLIDKIDSEISFVNEIAADYMMDITQKTISYYHQAIDSAKEIAKEYGLPEDAIIAKQKKKFLAELVSNGSNIENMYAISANGGGALKDMINLYEKEPDVISILVTQFFEGYITSGLQTNRFKENNDRFSAFTSALEKDKKLTPIGEKISDEFKDYPQLLKFMISHSYSLTKNAFTNQFIPEIVEFFQEEPDLFNKILKETLSKDSLNRPTPGQESQYLSEFQNVYFSNCIQFCANYSLYVNEENIKTMTANMNNFFLSNQKANLYQNIEKIKVVKNNQELLEDIKEISTNNNSTNDKENNSSPSFKL